MKNIDDADLRCDYALDVCKSAENEWTRLRWAKNRQEMLWWRESGMKEMANEMNAKCVANTARFSIRFGCYPR